MMAAMTTAHSLLHRSLINIESSHGHVLEHPLSVFNASHLLLKSYCVSRKRSFKPGQERFKSLIGPSVLLRSSSDRLSSPATSSSCRAMLDSQDGDLNSSASDVSTSLYNMEDQKCHSHMSATVLGGIGLVACAILCPESSSAVAEPSFGNVMTFAGAEPSNALSLPTWIIHVASVVEWVTAMALVWKYGDTKGKSAWKGLTWGMVPLLGGALCACTWHFFYNAESLEVLVVLQSFLTVVGNFTLWAAAYRIWKLSQEKVTAD